MTSHLLRYYSSNTRYSSVIITLMAGVIWMPIAKAQEAPPVVINLQTQQPVELIRAYWNANVDIANRPVVCDHFGFDPESAVYDMAAGSAGWPGGFYLSNDGATFTHEPLVRDSVGNATNSSVHHAEILFFRYPSTWTVQNGIYSGIAPFDSKEYLELVNYNTITTEITAGSTNNAIRVWHSEEDVRVSTYSVCYALDNMPFIPTGSAEIGNNDLPTLDDLNDFTFQFPQPVDGDATVPVIHRRDTGERVKFGRGEWTYNEQLALTSMDCVTYQWQESHQAYMPVPEFGYYVRGRRSFTTSFSAYFDTGSVSTRTYWTTDDAWFLDLESMPVESFQLLSGEPYIELTDYGFNLWEPQPSDIYYLRCAVPSPNRVLPLLPDNCDYSTSDQYDGLGLNAATQEGCPPEDISDNAMGEEGLDEQVNSDTSVSAGQTGNVENNTSVDDTVANDLSEQSNDGDDGLVETSTTNDLPGTTGNGSASTVSTEDPSSNVDSTPAQTSGSGATDKFLLLFLSAFWVGKGRRPKIG